MRFIELNKATILEWEITWSLKPLRTPSLVIFGSRSRRFDNERIEHALISFPEVKPLWFASLVDYHPKDDEMLNLLAWISQVFYFKDDELAAKTIELLWVIWKTRNDTVFSNKTTIVERALAITNFLSCYKEPQGMNIMQPTQISQPTWKPLDFGPIEVNFDAFVKKSISTGVGLICRDNMGEILAATTMFWPNFFEPSIARTMAFKWSIQIAAHSALP
ncbi:hypothetical protein D0Y65_001145 [Glycine soja]|uniref:RNase H type-1 domain-containing protein n=1 Tax=Glycine soja TaxID=3848 RepID=A0A445M1H0_GLYSO|nr:hypothetical protein D0Y65_001145 [Glycine soja]